MEKFKWTVEFEVNKEWVADGFNLTDLRALDMLMGDLVHAQPHELKAKVIKSPSSLEIADAQGYSSSKVIDEEIRRGTIK